jgi:hypothetical protein
MARINDPEGLREIDLQMLSKKALREFLDSLRTQAGLEMVRADARYCDFLVRRAFDWSQARGNAVDGDYFPLRQRFWKEPAPTECASPVLAHFDCAALKADPSAGDNAVELLGEPEFQTWFLLAEEAIPHLEALLEVKNSPIVLGEAQQRERLEAVIQRATREKFGGERAAVWARRLLEISCFFLAAGREEQARQALTVSLALGEADVDPSRIPFCDGLMRTSIGVLAQIESEKEAERRAGSLLVTPGELAEEQRRRQ